LGKAGRIDELAVFEFGGRGLDGFDFVCVAFGLE